LLVLLIGLPLGLFMLVKPKQMWRALQSWRFRDPEANEPSDAGYGLSALDGFVLMVGVLIMAALIALKPGNSGATTATSWPLSTFVPSSTVAAAPSQLRGAIPVVGYQLRPADDPNFPGQNFLLVSYLTPADANAVAGGTNTSPTQGCEVMRTVERLGAGRVTVDLQLYYSNPDNSYQPAEDEHCRVTGRWSSSVSTVRVTEFDPGAGVFTDGSIVGGSGEVLVAAAPGNVVPQLSATP
jgi:hypothetical protein